LNILILNSGSSSQKSSLYELGDTLPQTPPVPRWAATIEWSADKATVSLQRNGGKATHSDINMTSRQEATEHLLQTLWQGEAAAVKSVSEIHAVGHRVVHGGPRYRQPALVTDEVKAAIRSVSEFAPLHNRAELEGMESVERVIGAVPQFAVFDTGFHSTMPAEATAYPGPHEWIEQGIHRYVFHGINHSYCAGRAAKLLDRDPKSLKLVSCHLGNGCSLAAIRNGQSIDTTMGFTPLEGLMMGTRSGSVDPGILTYLMRTRKLSGEQLDEILNKKSGLLGISGTSSDMREIQRAMASGDARAKLAFDMFVHALQRGIGAMAAVLGGLDALVFTAGIGEHSPEVRAAVCTKLAFLGVQLDFEKNTHTKSDQNISQDGSPVPVLVIRAEEDWAIAEECWRLLGKR
jgi:acetate kinase